jgi:hypothetical protein
VLIAEVLEIEGSSRRASGRKLGLYRSSDDDRDHCRGPFLMSAERFIYALADWTVEKRADGWHFARSATRHSKGGWRGPTAP